MKKALVIMVGVFCIILSVNAGSARLAISKQPGKKNLASIVVTGNTGGWTKRYWLGVTYILAGGAENDFPAVRDSGKINKKYSIGLAGSVLSLNKSKKITWIARLWTRKVKKSNCKSKNCRWCLLNGYHLSGLVTQARKTGYTK
jgi:hypothetical protein